MKDLIVAAALLLLLPAGAMAQQARPFGASPVPCNSQGWSNCRVSFDGANVTRTYIHARGGPTTESHAGCTVKGSKISCPPGKWTTDKGFSGAAETLTITLDAAGRPSSTGH